MRVIAELAGGVVLLLIFAAGVRTVINSYNQRGKINVTETPSIPDGERREEPGQDRS